MQARMYQRTVLEWERQRLRLELEHSELLSRVNHLADEVSRVHGGGIASHWMMWLLCRSSLRSVWGLHSCVCSSRCLCSWDSRGVPRLSGILERALAVQCVNGVYAP